MPLKLLNSVELCAGGFGNEDSHEPQGTNLEHAKEVRCYRPVSATHCYEQASPVHRSLSLLTSSPEYLSHAPITHQRDAPPQGWLDERSCYRCHRSLERPSGQKFYTRVRYAAENCKIVWAPSETASQTSAPIVGLEEPFRQLSLRGSSSVPMYDGVPCFSRTHPRSSNQTIFTALSDHSSGTQVSTKAIQRTFGIFTPPKGYQAEGGPLLPRSTWVSLFEHATGKNSLGSGLTKVSWEATSRG